MLLLAYACERMHAKGACKGVWPEARPDRFSIITVAASAHIKLITKLKSDARIRHSILANALLTGETAAKQQLLG